MITSDLIAYIQAQIKKNISKETIVNNLTSAGWNAEDVEEGFLEIKPEPQLSPVVTEKEILNETKSNQWVDPYRELPDSDISIVGTKENPVVKEEPVIWNPKIETVAKPVSSVKVFTPVENVKPAPIVQVTQNPQIVQQKEIEEFLQAKLEKAKIEEALKIPPSFLVLPPEIKTNIPDLTSKTVLTQPVAPTEIKTNTPELDINPTSTQSTVSFYSQPDASTFPGFKIDASKIEIPPIEPLVVQQGSLVSSELNKEPKVSTESVMELPKVNEEAKIWTPTTIKPLLDVKPSSEISGVIPVLLTPQIETTIFPELKTEIPKIEIQQNGLNILPKEVAIDSSDGVILSEVSVDQPKKSFSDFKTNTSNGVFSTSEDLFAKKPISQVFPVSATEVTSLNLNQVKPLSIPIKLNQPIVPVSSLIPQSQNINIDNSPRGAMISSYKQALTSTNLESGIVGVKKRSGFKWIIVLIFILLIVSGTVFAFIKGYIKFPDSLIKKDPKIVLLNTTTSFGLLKSYKIDTKISISSPSFANIISGLVNGEAVVSKDIDSLTVSAKGLVSRNDSLSPSVDYTATIKGSFLKSDIETEIKYDGNTSYLKIPDLTSVLGKNSPSPSVVSVPNGQFNLIAPELPLNFQDNLQKIDAFQVLSKIMSSSFGSKVTPSFNDFLKNVTMVDKGSESIHGQDTYHYEVVVDGPTSKKFLVAMLNTFASTISSDTKTSIEESLGSTTVDSLEVWVGKNDSNIHQYKLSLSIPLSKVIGLDDKGIANNKVKLDWTTTYFDFDIPNTITMPTDSMKIEDYIKSIHDMKIKNTLSAFNPVAKNLFNAEGSFGKSPNVLGSCVSPVSGSIFSPLGHTKGAVTSVGTIASSMNDLLALSSGTSLCYSTPVAWAIAVPLSSDPNLFACADNTGILNTLSTAPKGPICK